MSAVEVPLAWAVGIGVTLAITSHFSSDIGVDVDDAFKKAVAINRANEGDFCAVYEAFGKQLSDDQTGPLLISHEACMKALSEQKISAAAGPSPAP